MAKIRLMKPEYATFSSWMGPVKFENGVSVDHVPVMMANHLAALTMIEVIDDEGKSAGQAGAAATMVANRGVEAPVLVQHTRGDDGEFPAEITPAPAELPNNDPEKTVENDPESIQIVEDLKEASDAVDAAIKDAEKAREPEKVEAIYTREALEEIADKLGISGLREVAPEGVKDTSINGLIDKILAHKPSPKAPVQEA